MKADNLLCSLCYLSVFFAPFLFPIIVFFLTTDDIRGHAAKAFWIHLISYISIFFGLGLGAIAISVYDQLMLGIIIFVLFVLISIYFFLLNIVRGIQLLIRSSIKR